MTPPDITPVLAEATSSLSESLKGALVLWVLGGLLTLSISANHIRQFFLSFRQNPPADDKFATKAEHRDLEGQVCGLRGEVSAMRTTLSNELRSIHRALGRIEGALGTMTPTDSQ
jgi:hypothetical protein